MTLKKIQAATGVLFAVFVIFHLLNTWLASFGPGAYDGLQAIGRWVYQFAPVEALLLAAVAVHAVVGIMRIVQEPKRQLTTRARWHRYAGFFLLAVIAGHVMAVRGPSWFYDVYPGFAGLSLSIHYLPAVFYPYYFLLALAGFYHAVNGLSIGLPRLGVRFTVPQSTLRNVTVVSALLTAAALLGLQGLWTDVGNPYESDIAKLAFELFDVERPAR